MGISVLVRPSVGTGFGAVAYLHFLGHGQFVLQIENAV